MPAMASVLRYSGTGLSFSASLHHSGVLQYKQHPRGHQTENSGIILRSAQPASSRRRRGLLIFALCGFGAFAFFYIRYDRIISKRMSGQIFSTSAKIYARPLRCIAETSFAGQIAARLRRAAYLDADNKQKRRWARSASSQAESRFSRPESYHSTDGAQILNGPDGRSIVFSV